MNYPEYSLPDYPACSDVWTRLAAESRPIVVWGMGNGADKLIEQFQRYGISISDFFASDGFVRGQYFHGYRVKSFAEIVEEHTDFVIVVSFASGREEVLDSLRGYIDRYTVVIPDMPVAGEEYFDMSFYNDNYESILKAYGRLSDEHSQAVYASLIWYKLTGDPVHLFAACSTSEEIYKLLPKEKIKTMVDAGAYNGDTVREGITMLPALRHAVAIEPDSKNFKRLMRYVSLEDRIEITPINKAVWPLAGGGEFVSSGNRNSSVSSTASHQHRMTDIDLISIDCLGLSPDYIKYDVEGAEAEALLGSLDTISTCRPSLKVSAYHRSEDIFSLVNYLYENTVDYSLYMRRIACFPAWEIDLIAVPK